MRKTGQAGRLFGRCRWRRWSRRTPPPRSPAITLGGSRDLLAYGADRGIEREAAKETLSKCLEDLCSGLLYDSTLANHWSSADQPLSRLKTSRKYPARCAHQTPSSRLESLASVSTKSGKITIDRWLAMLREALAKNYDRLDEVLAAMETGRRKDMP